MNIYNPILTRPFHYEICNKIIDRLIESIFDQRCEKKNISEHNDFRKFLFLKIFYFIFFVIAVINSCFFILINCFLFNLHSFIEWNQTIYSKKVSFDMKKKLSLRVILKFIWKKPTNNSHHYQNRSIQHFRNFIFYFNRFNFKFCYLLFNVLFFINVLQIIIRLF